MDKKISPYEMIIAHCDRLGWYEVRRANDKLVCVTGMLANVALLLMLLKDRTSMSASKVLGLNLVVMDLMFLCCLPMDYDTWNRKIPSPAQNQTVSDNGQSQNTDGILFFVQSVSFLVHLVGVPLLLGSMCVERYLAVMRPVLYLRLRKWEYKVAICVAVWTITCLFIAPETLGADALAVMLLPCFIISCTFVVMIACLGSVIRSLRQQCPAHAEHRKQKSSESALKRQAVNNVLVVVVPSVLSYSSLLAMSPIFIYIHYSSDSLYSLRSYCHTFQLSLFLLRYSVFIGPSFYFSRARQMCCLTRKGQKSDELP